ncbi:UNKNOWN [Stylonychia lemnae]|uniref:Uncharacterized protein n=1 Tax=Stylonychia lemnae TaxID=5949 RepID=A0A077ZYA6_STYLE|nr:UNKNOWN [Stylonychia lemnae]|eukprot:CDW74207.1 UNKNOWN [Stylonychia lemnae]
MLLLNNGYAKFNHGIILPQTSEFEYLVDENYFKFGLKFLADLGYGTHYRTTNTEEKREIYGIHLYSIVSSSITLDIGSFYQIEIEFRFVPLYWELYNQQIMWYRPEDENGFHFFVRGDRKGDFLRLETYVRENTKTIEESGYKMIIDGSQNGYYPELSDFNYDNDFKVEIKDYYWSYNLEDELNLDFVTDIITADYYYWYQLF